MNHKQNISLVFFCLLVFAWAPPADAESVPKYLQGDHTSVKFKNIYLAPVTK